MVAQYAHDNFPKHILPLLNQSDLRLIFTPPNSEIPTVAKSLNQQEWQTWAYILKNLSQGQCIADGMLTIEEHFKHQQLKISIPFLDDGRWN